MMWVRAALVAGAMLMGADAKAQPLSHDDVKVMPMTPPTAVEAYGDDPLQVGELRLPPGEGPFPVAVIVHGGCWTKSIGATLRYTAPMASALTADGIATWNIEYRQVGDPGGGWPGTFRDWAAATDHLRDLAERYPLDLSRVAVVGHSAGAHAAFWLAARASLPADSEIRGEAPLPLQSVVALDGPGDIVLGRDRAAEICGVDGILNVMGGTADAVPDRYAEGNPAELPPIEVPQLVVSSVIMPPEHGEAWANAPGRQGTVVHMPLKDSGHFDMLAPGTADWIQLLPFYVHFIRSDLSK